VVVISHCIIIIIVILNSGTVIFKPHIPSKELLIMDQIGIDIQKEVNHGHDRPHLSIIAITNTFNPLTQIPILSTR
jgi:hypothetical protein